MATQEIAIKNAVHSLKHGKSKIAFIYKIGCHWMFTIKSLKNIQKQYKIKISDYNEVKLG